MVTLTIRCQLLTLLNVLTNMKEQWTIHLLQSLLDFIRLKLHGVQEKDGEDVRFVVINVLGNVVPGISERMEVAVDIVHHLGPRRKDGTNRSIIILFALHHYRDTVWQAARGCKFLRDNKLRLSEALSPEDRVAGEKLWLLVKKARDEGKKVSFRGSFALIDGKRFDFANVK